MNLLTDEEMDVLFKAHYDKNQCIDTLLVAFESAILAKLASAELPEPVDNEELTHKNRWIYTADQLRQAYAQGAAAQLSAEPVAHLRKNGFRFLGDFEPQDDSELPLYTLRQAND